MNNTVTFFIENNRIMRAQVDKGVVRLSPLQADFLMVLWDNEGQDLTRDELLERLSLTNYNALYRIAYDTRKKLGCDDLVKKWGRSRNTGARARGKSGYRLNHLDYNITVKRF